jgi:hypothetical protein
MRAHGNDHWFSALSEVRGLALAADPTLELGKLNHTRLSEASGDTALTVEYDETVFDGVPHTYYVPRNIFYSAIGSYNSAAFANFVRKLDEAITMARQRK